jgi:hypothetical protein
MPSSLAKEACIVDEFEGILVLGSALKRDWITEEDIEHALAFSITSHDNDEDGSQMTVGPGRDGSLLEIGHRAKWGIRFVVFHAMDARAQFLPKQNGDDDADR